MIFSLKNGENFYQWDKGRVLIVHDKDVDQAHFANDTVTEAIEVDVYEKDEVRMVDVPDKLLEIPCTLKVYAYKCDGDEREYTRSREDFKVIARKPSEGETA